MQVGLLIIGDEILSGRTQDTNSRWLANFLFSKGLKLAEIVTIGDSKEELQNSLDYLINQYSVVITSGGIGPTKDDITKSTIAEYFDSKLEESEQARQIVQANYDRLNRPWNPSSNAYHVVPTKAHITNNPKGLAPGIVFKENNKFVMSAPGVPREFEAMVEEEFLPLFHSENEQDNFQRITIRTSRIPEEKIFFEMLPNLWDELSHFGKVSSLPNVIGVDIVITFKGSNQDKEKRKNEILTLLKNTPLNEYIWADEDIKLEEMIVKKASEKNITFSFAESCTGGLSASRITDISGSSQCFLGSYVTYANEVKSSALGVNPETIKKFGAVSVEVSDEMAKGAREKSQSDIAISYSGIAGPGGGTKEKPVGTVAISVSTKKETKGKIYNFKGDREKLKDRFSKMGLFLLLDEINSFVD